MSKKTGNYLLTTSLIASWKPRAKKIKLQLKELAPLGKTSVPHLSRLVRGKVPNPHLQTISDIEMALRAEEKKKGV